MFRVQRTSQAERDLVAIWSFVGEWNPEAADRLLETIDQKCDTLAQAPQMGRSREDLAPSLRSFPVGDYTIFYRAIEDGIEIMRVLHGARDVYRIFEGG